MSKKWNLFADYSKELYVSLLKTFQCIFASITVGFIQLIITKIEFSAFFSETGENDSLLKKKLSACIFHRN